MTYLRCIKKYYIGTTFGKLYNIESIKGKYYYFQNNIGTTSYTDLTDGCFELVYASPEDFQLDFKYFNGPEVPKTVSDCECSFQKYHGAREKYEFCIKCDRKREWQ